MNRSVPAAVAAVRTRLLTLSLLAALASVVPGCSSDSQRATTATSTEATTAAGAELTGSIVVSAAASLTDAFTTIEEEFVEANPGVDVSINFGSSGALATQISEGAPADVAAFADTAPMATLSDAGLLAAAPRVFARNQLVIVTKPGNPADITSLADLATAGVVSLCVDTAPCGRFANQILSTAGVAIPEGSTTRGADVRSTLTAVSEGDAVAGIVYVTDAATVAERVDTVDIPDSDNVVASYPIAVVRATASSDLAAAFQAYVLSDQGQAVLKAAGFLAP